jgi:D-arabinose 1-dehydrogenase-like Zn-dependent alcohol dehydrogenase
MVETYPLEKAAEAYDRMMSGKRRVSRRVDDVIAAVAAKSGPFENR